MKFFKTAILGAAAIMATFSCKSQFDALVAGNDVDAKYKAAFEYFNKGKYQKAATLFESMSVLTDGTERDDTVQYYWGLSNYRFKDYITAETNFTKFVTNFPRILPELQSVPFRSIRRIMAIMSIRKSVPRC